MPRTRNRLINAARRSMIQRAELRRKLSVAGEAFKPSSLYDRGKYRVDVKIDDTAHAIQKQFKNNRLPITLAAVVGLAWLFREPIGEHAPRLGRKLRDLADAGIAKIRPGDAPLDDDYDDASDDAPTADLEDQNEAPQ